MLSAQSTRGTANGHEWVDLGLPSGLKWACCNVGASSPEEYGDYFAWGETDSKSNYTEDNCATKGQNIGDIAGTSRDAARVNWGDSWRMPRASEIEELVDNCTWTWITQNGNNGYRVTGPNGNSIFLPAAGYRFGSSSDCVGFSGHYWGSTPVENITQSAYNLIFYSGRHLRSWNFRDFGQSVRPVLDSGLMSSTRPTRPTQSTTATRGVINGHEWVDLGLPSGLKWATCNVGASNPGDYGNYYAWGETSTKSSYDSSNCSTWEQNIGDIAGTSRDAARVNWGGRWRMPRKAEIDELLNNCTWTWTTQNGNNGCRVTGPNGNSIFLPAAGLRHGSSSDCVGFSGHYWGSTPDESNTQGAYCLFFNGVYHSSDWGIRHYGRSVRPVLE